MSSQPEDRKKRRRLAPIWWLAAAGGLVAVVVVVVLVAGGGDDSDEGGGDRTASFDASPTASVDSSVSGSSGGGADSSSNSESSGRSIEGEWEFIVDVTQAGGVCAGEEDEPSDSTIVRIEQTGEGSYEVTGLGGPGSEVWTGDLDGASFVFSGQRPEDGGTTTATFRMTLTDDGAMSGTEDWRWDDADSSCPDGLSDVHSTFHGPLG